VLCFRILVFFHKYPTSSSEWWQKAKKYSWIRGNTSI